MRISIPGGIAARPCRCSSQSLTTDQPMIKSRFASIILVMTCCALLVASLGAARAGGGRAAFSGTTVAKGPTASAPEVRDHRSGSHGTYNPQPKPQSKNGGGNCPGGGYAYGPNGWSQTPCRPGSR
jgi:hypothetical protein